jgi:hypothetical protein
MGTRRKETFVVEGNRGGSHVSSRHFVSLVAGSIRFEISCTKVF